MLLQALGLIFAILWVSGMVLWVKNNLEQGVKKLEAGRIDLLIGEEEVLKFLTNKKKDSHKLSKYYDEFLDNKTSLRIVDYLEEHLDIN